MIKPLPRLCLIFIAMISGEVLALDGQGKGPGTELQQQQEQRNIERQLDAPKVYVEPQVEPINTASPPANTNCLNIQKVEIDGVVSLKPKDLQHVLMAYREKCLGAKDIADLLQSINALYLQDGFIASRAYIPEQNASSGVLRLVAIEGRLESIELSSGKKLAESARVKWAFPVEVGEVLSLRKIEQGLDQINHAPSAQGVIAIEPGTKPGFSVVRVKTTDEKTFRANAYADNGGERATGIFRVGFGLEKDNLFKRNDSWQVGYSRTKNSSGLSLTTSLPYKWWLFNSAYSLSEYSNPISNEFDLNGQSQSVKLGAERLLFRNQVNQLYATTSLARQAGQREIGGTILNPDVSANLRAGLKYIRKGSQDSSLYISFNYAKGLNIFGAIDDPSALSKEGSPEKIALHAFAWGVDCRGTQQHHSCRVQSCDSHRRLNPPISIA